MKKVTDSYISEHLENGIIQLKRTNPEALWEQPVEKATGDEWFLQGVRISKKKNKNMIRVLSTIAACFAICFVSYYLTTMQVESFVYLDVNPSVELQLNKKEQVVQVEAKNADGQVILEDMNLKHTDMDVAVNAIIGSMVKHGYVSEAKNMILLSVESRDPAKADALRAQLSNDIHLCLDSLVGSGQVYNQNVEPDEESEDFAEEYGMTPGKASLIQKIVAQHPELKKEDLAEMKMHELMKYLDDSGVDVKKYVDVTGDVEVEEADDENDSEDEEKVEINQNVTVVPGQSTQSEKTEDGKEEPQEEEEEQEEEEQESSE